MDEQENGKKTEPTKGRHRSPNYPAIGLKEAVDKIGKLYKADGLAPSLKAAALGHMGFEKPAGDGARVLSALKSFGLVQEVDGRVKLTQRGIDIVVRPEDDPLRMNAVREAALGPQIYKDLLKECAGRLPSDATLKAELIAVKKFNPNAVEYFIKDLKATLDFSGLSDSGVLELKSEEETEDGGSSPKDRLPGAELPSKAKPRLSRLNPPSENPNMREDVFSLAEGDVTFQWPTPLSADSIQDLRDWLKIVERKIARSMTTEPAGGIASKE